MKEKCFSHQEKYTKIPSAHISLTYIHLFAHPIEFFFPYVPILQKLRIYLVGFALVRLPVLILNRAILEQSVNNIMVSKI